MMNHLNHLKENNGNNFGNYTLACRFALPFTRWL